jgi:TonB-dependent Receptor Plug Domain
MRSKCVGTVVIMAVCATGVVAQTPASARSAPVATVTGIVYDSVGRAPLVGAMVQLAGSDTQSDVARTAISDSLGRFRLDSVPNGRFMIGFFHPMLDSLGIEAPLREVFVARNQPARSDLFIPSPAKLRAAICGARGTSKEVADSGGVILGVVRNAHDGAVAPGSKVTVTWSEVSFSAGGITRRTPSLSATTQEAGWYALCDVPASGLIGLVASRGADSTDRVEIQMPEDGFLRGDFYLAPSPTVVVTDVPVARDSLAPRDSLPPIRRRERRGEERLAGTVIAVAGGAPIVGADVSIADGPHTKTNDRGEWFLTSAPGGTRMLDVRAVGYYPVRRPVNVVSGRAPIRIPLSTLKSVLDTVRVSATRRVYDRQRSGFADRRRSGAGKYFTREDIARRQPIVVSDLFRTIAGVRVEFNPDNGTMQLLVRGNFAEWCNPPVYLDGMHLGVISADELDGLLTPSAIENIEVYAGPATPPQFDRGLGGPACGAIVIWTR